MCLVLTQIQYTSQYICGPEKHLQELQARVSTGCIPVSTSNKQVGFLHVYMHINMQACISNRPNTFTAQKHMLHRHAHVCI